MDTYECITGRRSIRKFLQIPVEFDKVALILEAATHAPSAGDLHDYRFIIVTEQEKIKEIADSCSEQYWVAQAPMLIVVCSDTEKCEAHYGLRGQRLYSVQSAAAAIQNILLTAHSLGLGGCWVGSFNESFVSDRLGVPDTVRPQAIIPLGYPDEVPKEKDEAALNAMIFFNEYGNDSKNINMYLRNYSDEIARHMRSTEKKLDVGIGSLSDHAKRLINELKKKMNK